MGKTSRISPIKVSGKYTTKALSQALAATDGQVYLAAQRLGCSAKTIYNHLQSEPALAQLLEELRGRFLDLAETSLRQAVIRGDGWAVCFVLKTLGKERGYVERSEITGKDGSAMRFGVMVVPGTLDRETWQQQAQAQQQYQAQRKSSAYSGSRTPI
jgi:hypothetical protein